MRFFLAILAIIFYTSSLSAKEPSFKFTFGSNIGKIPLVINRVSKNIMTSPGININSWILSPNFSSFVGKKKSSRFLENKKSKESIYIKFKFKF